VVITIYAKTIGRALITAVLLITLASLAARVAKYAWGYEGLLQPLRLFDVGEESNIPTWFSSLQLLLCSVLLAAIAVAQKRRGGRYGLHWGVLSLIFMLLSLDEGATIHEAMGQELERLLGSTTGFEPGGLISFFWVVPGAAFMLVVLLAYLRFLAHLPGSTRRLFLLAGALFVLGALGMEMLSAQVVSASGGEADWESVSGLPKIVVGLQTSVEEMLEMLGVAVFAYALLAYMGSYVEGISVRVRIETTRAEDAYDYRAPRSSSRRLVRHVSIGGDQGDGLQRWP
jgi:hypothetical protein